MTAFEIAKIHAAQCRNLIAAATPEPQQPVEDKPKSAPKARPVRMRQIQVPEGMKCCTACRYIKPLDAFYASASGRYGVMARCKECYRAQGREYMRNKRANNKSL